MTSTLKILLSATAAVFVVSAHTPSAEAQHVLLYGNAEYLGRAHPNKEKPERFVLCDGTEIKPVEGEIRDTAQRCVDGIFIAQEPPETEQQETAAQEELAAEHWATQEQIEQAVERYKALLDEIQEALNPLEEALNQDDLADAKVALREAREVVRVQQEMVAREQEPTSASPQM